MTGLSWPDTWAPIPERLPVTSPWSGAERVAAVLKSQEPDEFLQLTAPIALRLGDARRAGRPTAHIVAEAEKLLAQYGRDWPYDIALHKKD